MIKQSATFDDVLQLIRQWPPEQQFSLVQSVLELLARKVSPQKHQRKHTLSQALGLLQTSAPAPSDAQVQAWLEQRRIEKYD